MTQTLDFNALFGFATTCHACGVTLDSENTHPISDERGWCVECAERQMARESIGLFFEALAQYAASCKPARTRKARKTDEQRKHEHFLRLAVLVRQGRLHRMPVGISRASFDVDGAHVDVYASSTFTGYGYIVRSGDRGYECGCEQFEYRQSCKHTRQSSARAVARYEEARRQAELATAEQVALLVLGESFAADLPAHIDDEIAGQQDVPQVAESCDCCGRWSRLSVCAWCAGVAA